MKISGIVHQKSFTGFLFAGLAALSVSNVYIFSKAALLVTPIFTFGFYWFMMALFYNVTLVMSTGKYKLLKTYQKKVYKALTIIGFFELLGTVTFFMAIKQIENPAIASFLVNTTPVFVTLISIPILNERFKTLEIVGIVILLSGAFMLSYSGTFSFDELLVQGANLMILSCLLIAIALVIAKKNIKNIDPYLLSLNRVVFIFLFYTIALFFSGATYHVTTKAFVNIALGSLFGPFLGAILQYNSYRFIEVSKASLIQNTNGIFVIISTYLYFGLLPLALQIAGGIITILGMLVMVVGKYDIIKLPGFKK